MQGSVATLVGSLGVPSTPSTPQPSPAVPIPLARYFLVTEMCHLLYCNSGCRLVADSCVLFSQCLKNNILKLSVYIKIDF